MKLEASGSRHRIVRTTLLLLVAAFIVACQQTPQTVQSDGGAAPPAAMTSADLHPDRARPAPPTTRTPAASGSRDGSVTWMEPPPPPAPPASARAKPRPQMPRSAQVAPRRRFPERPQTAARRETPRRTPPAAVTELDGTPKSLITRLEEVGLTDGFNGKGWHRSRYDGRWNAMLLKNYGRNEVSCLLESGESTRVQRIELEAEVYRPGVYEQPLLLQFTQAVTAVYPDAPRPLLEAIASKQTWYDEHCYLTRDDYRAGGYGLRLRINR